MHRALLSFSLMALAHGAAHATTVNTKNTIHHIIRSSAGEGNCDPDMIPPKIIGTTGEIPVPRACPTAAIRILLGGGTQN